MPAIEPTTPTGLADAVTALALSRAGRVRVLIDGPPPGAPDKLAAAVAERSRLAGRVAVVVLTSDFLRPASVRLEFGREVPDELLDGWLDEAALRREVLDPAADSGSGRVLPRLWNAAVDRAHRATHEQVPGDGVVLVAGQLLLGRGLPAELRVHLRMSDTALARRLPPDQLWTLPAHRRYAAERHPESEADMVALIDHPDRPALRRR